MISISEILLPLMVARTPISEPTEMSIFPDMITMDIPIAATAIYAFPRKRLIRFRLETYLGLMNPTTISKNRILNSNTIS